MGVIIDVLESWRSLRSIGQLGTVLSSPDDTAYWSPCLRSICRLRRCPRNPRTQTHPTFQGFSDALTISDTSSGPFSWAPFLTIECPLHPAEKRVNFKPLLPSWASPSVASTDLVPRENSVLYKTRFQSNKKKHRMWASHSHTHPRATDLRLHHFCPTFDETPDRSRSGF